MCVLFVGRLVEQKRPEMLLRVYHELVENLENQISNNAKKSTKVHLLIVGDGILQDNVNTYISNNDLTNKVTMLGKVRREDMSRIMLAGDVIFLPSNMEDLAAALIEAMGMGQVPVVTVVGGQREIFQKGTG